MNASKTCQPRHGTIVLAIAFAFVLASCGGGSDPTGPPPGTVTVGFRPNSTGLNLTAGESQDLWVLVDGTDSYTVSWRYGLQTADTDTFHLLADNVGIDTVWATVATAKREQNRNWRVDVVPDLSSLPREVSGLAVDDAGDPAAVVVSWLRSSPTVFDLESYEVAVSYTGPINVENWDEAAFVVTEAHDELAYRQDVTVSNAEHGLNPGEQAWFAVRAVDVFGQTSLIKESLSWVVTYPWYLDVHVQDDSGLPIGSLILVYGPDDERSSTDGSGDCRLGPFRNIDTVPVATRADAMFYNYSAPPHGLDDGPLLITLVERYVLDMVDCGISTPATEFMSFMQYMTRTDTEVPERPNRKLYRWSEYPIQVHFVEWDTLGVQFADSLRSAMAIWNDHVGFEIMTETADVAAAHVQCSFRSLGGALAGRVWSPDHLDRLEVAVPRVFEVYFDPEYYFPNDVMRPVVATEVALHEFGHVLGLYDHFCLSGKGNLMDNGGAFGILADGPANAIKASEMRVVRAITNMAQGVDMAGYELD
ncbi:MAG: hypothetical protein GY838_06460 [bacterium]|nr:hypothetical protein [bacterium]